MARKITSGRVGRAVLGSLTTVNNSLQSVVTNANVLFEPNGTGITVSTKDLQINAQSNLRLADGDSSNYIALRAPATVASNITYTFPGSGVTNDLVLRTDSSGNLSWIAPYVTVTNQTTDTATYYPSITTATSGNITGVGVSNSKLTFQPSTGTLFATIGQFATMNGSTANSGTLTLRGTSSATKATASVLMTDGVASTTTTSGTLVVTGGVGVSGQLTAATLVETSSIAFKENVNQIDNALDIVMQLFGVTYDRKDTGKHEAGLIAEDVYKVVPDLVALDEHGKPYGLQYTKLTAYLIESIKSLKQELDLLRK
jgi:hypothetical protein